MSAPLKLTTVRAPVDAPVPDTRGADKMMCRTREQTHRRAHRCGQAKIRTLSANRCAMTRLSVRVCMSDPVGTCARTGLRTATTFLGLFSRILKKSTPVRAPNYDGHEQSFFIQIYPNIPTGARTGLHAGTNEANSGGRL